MKNRLDCRSLLKTRLLLTFSITTLSLLFAWSPAVGRGTVVVTQGGDGNDFPDGNWAISRAFSNMYGFRFNGSQQVKIYVGHSAGGNHAYGNAVNNAANTLCATPHGWKHDGPNNNVKNVPIFTLTGQHDFGNYNVQMVQESNRQGHLQSVAWHRGNHHNLSYPELIYLFWIENIRLRYRTGTTLSAVNREEGWLGDLSIESWDSQCPYIAPYSEYEGDKASAAWLPTRSFAFAWRAFVVGKGTAFTSPIVVTEPMRTGAHGKWWEGIPTYNAGDSVRIQAQFASSASRRVVFYYGDNVIAERSANPYGVYSVWWKKMEAGVHGIVIVAYDQENRPIATSRLVPVIVHGTPVLRQVDNSSIENSSRAATAIDYSIVQQQRTLQSLVPVGNASRGYWLLNGRSLHGAQSALPVIPVRGSHLPQGNGGSIRFR